MKGSTYKRCKCRGDDGKELGAQCPKLRRKDGSWNPRHGAWYYRLELDAGPGGKRRTLRRGGFASEADAAAAMDEAKVKEARGGNAQQKVLVGDYLDEWIATRRGLSRSTHRRYSIHIRKYLKPHLGHIELDRLRVKHLSEMFDAIEADNDIITAEQEQRRALRDAAAAARRAGDTAARDRALDAIAQLPPVRRTVGPSTRQQIRATLRAALSDAARQELISANVAKLVKLSAGKRPKPLVWTPERTQEWREAFNEALAKVGEPAGSQTHRAFRIWRTLPRPSKVMVWTPEQTGIFLDHATEHRLYALWHLMAFTGIRRGEACGLAWPDVDLTAGEIAIRIQRVMASYDEVEDSDLKTDSSDDTIPIDATTVKVLHAHRAQQREDQMAWGREAWVRSGKVFTRENGEALHPDHLAHWFQSIVFRAGLPPIRLHDLRHGAATLMLAAGADMKLVQAMLRHASITLTSDTYTSVLPEVFREATEAAAALVPRAVSYGGPSTGGLPTVSRLGSPQHRDAEQATNPQVNPTAGDQMPDDGNDTQVISSTAENVSDGPGS